MKLANRDDLPPEILEAFQKMHPDFKIVCAGDIPGEPPEAIKAMIEKIESLYDKSLVTGTCVDCGAKMPNFPANGDLPEDWKPAEGWTWFLGPDNTLAAWQCPTCDANEEFDEVRPA